MLKKTIWLGAFLACLVSCNSQTDSAAAFREAAPLVIHRFDRALLGWLEQPDSSTLDALKQDYYPMLELTGKGILNVPTPERADFYERLGQYYSEPTLQQLYRDAVAAFDSVGNLEQTLGQAFAFLKAQFPDRTVPALYMHVSGFNQNVLAGDSALSLSIDKYIGENYPLYREFFYDYDRRKMTRERAAIDYVAGWLMSEFPFSGRENVLLDRMIYEGKINYLLSLALPDLKPEEIIGYTEEEYRWCEENEKPLWNALVSRKHLYTPDITTTQKYFENRPCSFLADKTPGNVGTWIGRQIIDQYVRETRCGVNGLMNGEEDSQKILAASKYKP